MLCIPESSLSCKARSQVEHISSVKYRFQKCTSSNIFCEERKKYSFSQPIRKKVWTFASNPSKKWCASRKEMMRVFAMYYLVAFHLLPLCLDVLGLWARWTYTNALITAAFSKQRTWKEKEIQQALSVGACDFCMFAILVCNCHLYRSPDCYWVICTLWTAPGKGSWLLCHLGMGWLKASRTD